MDQDKKNEEFDKRLRKLEALRILSIIIMGLGLFGYTINLNIK